MPYENLRCLKVACPIVSLNICEKRSNGHWRLKICGILNIVIDVSGYAYICFISVCILLLYFVTSTIGIYHTEYLVNRFALCICRVLGQVSCELVSPKLNRATEGILFFNLELSQMAAPAFEPGRYLNLF